jgi:uncharacterized membrane protein YhaH (DUF805 family)
MNEEQTTQHTSGTPDGIAGQMVEEAARRYKDVPKSADLKSFQFGNLFTGRLDRENYIYGLIAGIILGAVLSFIPIIGWIIGLGLCVVGFGVTVRRLHDIAQTGWIALLGFIPVIGLFLMVYLAFAKAVDEGNTYGPKPDPKRGFYHAMLNM